MPRLFAAIEVPHHVALSLSLLRGGLQRARWIDVENYHITLRFIGDVDHRTTDDLLNALDRVATPEFDLSLTGLGTFGSKKPRSIWAGVASEDGAPAPDEIFNLHHAIERQCVNCGIAPDKRRFTPHVTLARLKGANQFDIGDYLSSRGNFKTQSFQVKEFHIMSSRRSVGGGPYMIEETYPLDYALSLSEDNFVNNASHPMRNTL